VAGVLTWPGGDAVAAVEPDDFVIENAADLVDVCSADTESEFYVQAVHMCHGYVAGAAQYALLLFEQSGAPYFCLPEPRPTRGEAVEAFVSWMNAHEEFVDAPAPEALARFLEASFPCE
jgi:hypothetical protein